jgi:prophage regulatory protein
MADDDIRRILRRREVQTRTGLPTSSLYDFISHDQFPRPVKLSAHRVGWIATEVDDWIARRIADRDHRKEVARCKLFCAKSDETLLDKWLRSRAAYRSFIFETDAGK